MERRSRELEWIEKESSSYIPPLTKLTLQPLKKGSRWSRSPFRKVTTRKKRESIHLRTQNRIRIRIRTRNWFWIRLSLRLSCLQNSSEPWSSTRSCCMVPTRRSRPRRESSRAWESSGKSSRRSFPLSMKTFLQIQNEASAISLKDPSVATWHATIVIELQCFEPSLSWIINKPAFSFSLKIFSKSLLFSLINPDIKLKFIIESNIKFEFDFEFD